MNASYDSSAPRSSPDKTLTADGFFAAVTHHFAWLKDDFGMTPSVAPEPLTYGGWVVYYVGNGVRVGISIEGEFRYLCYVSIVRHVNGKAVLPIHAESPRVELDRLIEARWPGMLAQQKSEFPSALQADRVLPIYSKGLREFGDSFLRGDFRSAVKLVPKEWQHTVNPANYGL